MHFFLFFANFQAINQYVNNLTSTDEENIESESESVDNLEVTNRIIAINSLGLNNWNEQFLQSLEEDETVSGVRCIAHTVNLVLNDAIKHTNNIVTTISLIRTVVKALRQNKTQSKLKECNVFVIQPRLDCVTRWSSTYSMVYNAPMF